MWSITDGFCFNIFLIQLKQETSDLSNLESKWDIVEPKRTPDLDQMDIEQYQVCIHLRHRIFEIDKLRVCFDFCVCSKIEEHCPKKQQPSGYPSRYKSIGEFGESNAGTACSSAAIDASPANRQYHLWIATTHSRSTKSQSNVVTFKLRFEPAFVTIAATAAALQQHSTTDEPRTNSIH